MGTVRDRLRGLLADPDRKIWSDSELDEFLAAHQQRFAGVRLERCSPTTYVCPDGRWLWADGFMPVIYVEGATVTPVLLDRVRREVVLGGSVAESAVVCADFVGVNLYYAAAEAKLAAAGDPARQQAIIAQGQIRLSERTAAEQLREDAEILRRLGLPETISVAISPGRRSSA